MAHNFHKAAQKIDIYFMLLLFFSYVLFYVVRFVTIGNDLFFIVMLNVMYLALVVSYFSRPIMSIAVCAAFVAGYGGYILYRAILQHAAFSTETYVWMAAVPLCCVALSFYRTYLAQIEEKISEQNQLIETLSGFDENTNLPNERMFQYELGRYMSMASRGYIKVTLMFIRIHSLGEIRRLIGNDKLGGLYRAVGETICEITRSEDAGYFVDEKGLYSLILISDARGAAIVKERIKKNIQVIDLQDQTRPIHLNLDLRIGIAEYNSNIRTSVDFREMALKDMELDV